MNEVEATVTGNLCAPPQLATFPSGTPVATLRVAFTPRFYVKDTNSWAEDTKMCYSVQVTGPAVENVKNLKKGDRVMCHGFLRRNEYRNKLRDLRDEWKIVNAEVAASLKFASVDIHKNVLKLSKYDKDTHREIADVHY